MNLTQQKLTKRVNPLFSYMALVWTIPFGLYQ